MHKKIVYTYRIGNTLIGQKSFCDGMPNAERVRHAQKTGYQNNFMNIL